MTFAPKTPIAEILTALDTGQTTAAALLDTALERARDASGEGARVFIALMEDSARAEAAASDGLRKAGVPPRPLEGLPISVKDLFDVKGAVTTAGSKVLASEPPAEKDAPVVARLRAAGAVLVGRTNMTEFAYSGLGINPHYGTPANAWDRASKRIPGGSSSGAAVSVTDGMASVGLGTDTGGSVRIPAGLCGLAGFKPTQSRVPIAGAVPLSTSLDSIGPLAPSMDCCVRVHQVLAGETPHPIPALPVKGLRLAVPKEFVLDDLDEPTAAAFQAALSRISSAGATIIDLSLPELLELPVVNAKGGFTAPESYALHERHILRDPDAFDPRVISRMRRAGEQSAADYFNLVNARADIQARVAAKTSAFDAVLMPTTPRIAPPIADLVPDDAVYGAINMAMLRNCSVGNFLDRCAATIAVHEEGSAPVGLMIMGETLADDRVLAISQGLETLFA
ncbi:amidase [Thalassobaculum sp.]|uniref:amidase n=1 Tax=Thalassobaculum sp. TaxID=2022740 RepID=UPI003B5A0656